MPLEVRPFRAEDKSSWDRFVDAHPHGSPMHGTAWKETIEEVYGYRSHYLLAEEDGALRGVLPLFLISNLLMGKVLLSTPFAVYGGILADGAEARQVLAGQAAQIAREMGVQHLELRNAYEEQCAGFARVSRYVTFTQEVGPDETVVLNSIPRKTRAAVRKSFTFNLEGRETRELPAFERLYDESLRRLGTPSFPSRHFTTLLKKFGERAGIREVVYEGRVVAAVFSFFFGDQVLPYYGASDAHYLQVQPNNFMYYDLMRWAGQNGYHTFDFGRSKKEGSGSHDFKAHWGMVERELPYEMLLIRRKELPNFTPNNPKFQLAIQMWRKLPLAVTKTLGPYLLRLVP